MYEDLTAHLLADATLTDLVGDRVAWLRMPSSVSVWPYVVLTPIPAPDDYHSAGASALHEVRLQLDIYALSMASALAVRRAVKSRLGGFQGVAGATDFRGIFYSGGSATDDETPEGVHQLTRIRDDYLIHFKTTETGE